MKTLITFDIDGTLLNFSDKGHCYIRVFNQTFADIFGGDKNPRDYLPKRMCGATDKYLLSYMIKEITKQPETDEKLYHQFHDEIISRFVKEFDGSISLTKGCKELLDHLSKMKNVGLGVCTGNFPEIAQKKLSSCGILDYFDKDACCFGASEERTNVLADAIASATNKHGKFSKVIHFGDTVPDYNAALDNKAFPFLITYWGFDSHVPQLNFKNTYKDFIECKEDLLTLINSE
ncbi:haloacid dehalogenase-like hydrolase family protein [Trichomonas vaginalis G3]|uniref:Haloacid dehalogenase-like hydrolase family protein n=1 Tax=Trichomonas vaginalis (strain ATCC PRA-98 / G3) TaxID=412133 RepID=A2FK13_TRIV3|nr:putative phosphatase, domain 2 domain-containing protein [Trichomonas vaginalis G3]EAX94760.1 haloacid dehalogenase-like hydrolase family protein [Trichomonas vaginalis G3]KAI5491994.1 putative phosphatase, domain 2 domain-containing protein [Trichomonas vaginalis G3]|eukprot:XP_001307690.1 haloacid dehalogenase-like hydrolase family protein [Trichomonas vaginalis G3]